MLLLADYYVYIEVPDNVDGGALGTLVSTYSEDIKAAIEAAAQAAVHKLIMTTESPLHIDQIEVSTK